MYFGDLIIRWGELGSGSGSHKDHVMGKGRGGEGGFALFDELGMGIAKANMMCSR